MHVLLLGAGFSRNWNGWLAIEVMGELLGRLASDPGSYMLLRKAGNFEDALSQAQADARSRPTPEARARLEHVEHAILDTFGEMNRTFARLPGNRVLSGCREINSTLFVPLRRYLHPEPGPIA